MNVVITGVTGMIGVSLAKECISHGDRVFGVVRNDTQNLSRIENIVGLQIVRCDIEDYDSLHTLIGEECNVMFHLAWEGTGNSTNRNANLYNQVNNIKATLSALDTAHKLGCKTFVGAGSQAEYGIRDSIPISPNDSTDPIQPYGIAKYAAGKLVRVQAERYNMNCFWVRIFSIYGEYQKPDTMIAYTISTLLKKGTPKYSPAKQIWDYLYCDDAAEAMYLIGKQPCGNKVYCLGSGEARELSEYIGIIKDRVDPALHLDIGAYDYSPNAVMKLSADISEITKDTGWVPKTTFEAGIDRVLEFEKLNFN